MSKKTKKNTKKKQPQNKERPVVQEAVTESLSLEEALVEVEAENGVKAEKQRSSMGVRIAKYATAAVVALVLFWFGFTTVVKEGDCAVILRFGAVREEVTEAGLYFKLPWPFESVVSYDNRLQYLESNRLETTTKDNRNIVLQSYVVWEIDDPVLYHNSVGSRGLVDSYINDQVFSATNSTMGSYELSALVSLEEEQIKIDKIQEEIFDRVQENCLANYGIHVIDVSILRISFPDSNLEAVFERIRAARQTEIDDIIARAQEEAEAITGKADETAAGIVGEGQIEAAKRKAEAEAAVAAIYDKATNANQDLFQFLMDLDAAVAALNSNAVLVVDSNDYPFNILLTYSKEMTAEGNKTVISDLEYILSHPDLSTEDRDALVEQIIAVIEASSQSGAAEDTGTTP